jgi:hypothetical protein
MNRKVWMGLPLAFVLGCHHNLIPDHGHSKHGCGHGGGAAADAFFARRFANTRTQVAFVSPVDMAVGWEAGSAAGADARSFMPAMLTVPNRYNFDQGAIYRLKLTNIPGHPTVAFYPTLEVAPSSPRTDAYLTHNAVPIEFTDEDFDQVSVGNFVTKVIYLPDPQHQELAIAGVETLVSTRLDPGVDPIAEADRRGTILVIVRLGGINLEMVQPATGSASDADGSHVIQMADNGGFASPAQPPMRHEPSGQATIRR